MSEKWKLVKVNFHGEFISGLHNSVTGETRLILKDDYKKPMMDVLEELEAVKKEREQLQRNFEQLDFQHSAVCKEVYKKELTIDQMKNEIEARGRDNTGLKKERGELIRQNKGFQEQYHETGIEVNALRDKNAKAVETIRKIKGSIYEPDKIGIYCGRILSKEKEG